MVVIINAYTGVLTAILAAPKLETTVNTLDELANRKRHLKLTVEEGSSLANQFLVQV